MMNNLLLLYEWADCEGTGSRILVARRDAAAQARREAMDATFVAGEEFLGDELYAELEVLTLGTNKELDLAMAVMAAALEQAAQDFIPNGRPSQKQIEGTIDQVVRLLTEHPAMAPLALQSVIGQVVGVKYGWFALSYASH